jgi:hypothetical protein
MLNQIVKIRYRDGTEVALVDWTDRPSYSTVEILHGTTQQEIDFFQYTVGDTVPAFAPVPVIGQRNATVLDTDLAAPGAMASTEEMLIFAIRPDYSFLELQDADEPDFNDIVPFCPVGGGVNPASALPLPPAKALKILGMRYLLLCEISQKAYAQARLDYFNFGAGTQLMGADLTMGMAAAPGVPAQYAVRSFAIPQHIGGTEKFSLQLRNPPGTPVEVGIVAGTLDADDCVPTRFVRITIYLDGLKKRPTS